VVLMAYGSACTCTIHSITCIIYAEIVFGYSDELSIEYRTCTCGTRTITCIKILSLFCKRALYKRLYDEMVCGYTDELSVEYRTCTCGTRGVANSMHMRYLCHNVLWGGYD